MSIWNKYVDNNSEKMQMQPFEYIWKLSAIIIQKSKTITHTYIDGWDVEII